MHDLGPEPGPPGDSSDSVFCPVRLGVGLGDFLVEPRVHLLSDTILMPNTYHASGDPTAVCLINASDKEVVLEAERECIGVR